MPFIVHVHESDLQHWEQIGNRGQRGTRCYYRPRMLLRGVVLSSPQPLEEFIGKDLFCKIGVEKMHDEYRRTHIYLSPIRNLTPRGRKLRLVIDRTERDSPTSPHKVYLKEVA